MSWLRAIDPLAVEAAVLLAGLLAGSILRGRDRRCPRTRRGEPGARGPLGVLAAFLLGASVAALLLALRAPQPHVHDEFGYLLLADTFASGRLASLPPVHAEAYETFHVLLSPAYAAKFPPAQGVVLATGQVLAGHPQAGLWISAGICCALVCWALQAWVGPRWALVGALLAVGRVSLTYWSHSYWGGSAAASGGALVVGAVARISRRPTLGHGAALGLGLAILANSRPYEGLAFALAGLGVLALGGSGRRPLAAFPGRLKERLRGSRAAGSGALLVLLPAAAGMAVYNRCVTGSALTLPHMAYDRSLGISSFPWRGDPARPQRHPEMARFVREFEAPQAARHRDLLWLVGDRAGRIARLFAFFVGLPLALPLAMAVRAALRGNVAAARAARAALVWLAVLTAGLLVPVWLFMHYAAPGLVLVIGLEVWGLRELGRRLERTRRGPRRGWVTAAVVLALLAGQGVRFARREGYEWRLWPERGWVLAQLAEAPGRDLVFVEYAPDHDVHDEWVYNGADLGSAPVVWARSRGPVQDAPVRADWRDRRSWLLRADGKPPRLIPYEPVADLD